MKKKPSQGRGNSRAGKSERGRPASGRSRTSGSEERGPRSSRPARTSSWDDFDRAAGGDSENRKRGTGSAGRKPFGDREEKRPYQRRDDREEKRPYQRRDEGDSRERKPFGEREEKRPYQRRDDREGKRPYQRRDEGNSRERKPFGEREEKRPYQRRDDREEKRPYQRRDEGDSRERKPFGEREEKRPYQRRDDREEKRPYQRRDEGDSRERKPFGDREEKRPYQRRDDREEKRPYQRRDEGDSRERKSFGDRQEKRPYQRRDEREEKKPYDRGSEENFEKRGFGNREENDDRSFAAKRRGNRPPSREERHAHFEEKYAGREKRPYGKKEYQRGAPRKRNASAGPDLSGEIRLNRYISMAGIGSRREADELITAGLVTVNGKLVTELGSKVMPGDDVRYNGERIRNEKHVYLLLNKPKDYITTSEDPDARKTVMELIDGACKERVYPVGRLDRQTTGLLLFTNDGDLAKYLTHPSSKVRKLYHVELDKNVKVADMRKLLEGVELEDGISRVDEINFAGDGSDKKAVGVELHSGKNRVVRRLFEALGYDVRKLDRVSFAGLTKKDLPRGRWRKLDEKEIGFLKMMGTGKKKAQAAD